MIPLDLFRPSSHDAPGPAPLIARGLVPLAILAVVDLVLGVASIGFGVFTAEWFGAVHTSLTLTGLFLTREIALRRDDWSCTWNGVLLPLGATVGPCGIVLLAVLRPWSASAVLRERRRPDKAGQALAQTVAARLLEHRIRFPESERVQSLRTIIRHGDLNERCKALETAVRSFEPRLSCLVAAALSDPDQTVRALAAATSAQVSANVMERVAQAEAEPPATLAGQYDFALFLFENGCNNVLLSHSQRVKLRNLARPRLIDLLRNADLADERGRIVSCALVRLGTDLARDTGGRPVMALPKEAPELAAHA